jgi:hypothetical protein
MRSPARGGKHVVRAEGGCMGIWISGQPARHHNRFVTANLLPAAPQRRTSRSSMTPAHRQLRTRTAAWLLVFTWIGAIPGLLPLLFATVAWVEGSHNVELRSAGDCIRVLLTHGAGTHGVPHAQIHEHHLLAKMLAVCTCSDGEDADHIAKFLSNGTGLSEQERLASVEAEATAAKPEHTAVAAQLPERPFASSRLWLRGAPPDSPPAHFPGKRSTLLLI